MVTWGAYSVQTSVHESLTMGGEVYARIHPLCRYIAQLPHITQLRDNRGMHPQSASPQCHCVEVAGVCGRFDSRRVILHDTRKSARMDYTATTAGVRITPIFSIVDNRTLSSIHPRYSRNHDSIYSATIVTRRSESHPMHPTAL